MLTIFRWIDRSELDQKGQWLLYIAIALPMTLLLTTTDYLAYLNSLYQDTAGLVFSICVLIAIGLLIRRRSWWIYFLIMLMAFFMATAKASTFYWPFLAVIGITLITLSPITRKSLFSLALLLIAAVVIAIAGLSATRRGYNPKANEYQSLFAGVLALSSKPHQHLAQIGMPEATNCVGVNLYLKERCVKILDKYPEAITFTNVAKVIIREPLIFPRMVKFLADRMQDISIDLGKYSEGSGENRGQVSMLNLWSVMKQRFFPKGIYLLGILSFYLALFSINQKGQRIRREMAVIGLIATLACLLDMWVAFLGEGQADLIKHLLLSNFMFDIATVMALGLITLSIYQRIQNSSRVSGINPL